MMNSTNTQTRKPALPGVTAENIPIEMRERPQWVLEKICDRDGEKTKLPFQVNGKPAKSNDPQTWCSFDDAFLCYKRGGFDGIGFVFSRQDDFCGIDLDGCRNPETGEVAEWAKEIVTAFATYTEISPSKSGLKLICLGKSPLESGKNKKLHDAPKVADKTPGVEVYDNVRFFVITSWILSGSPNSLVSCQQQLNELCAKHWPPTAPRRASPTAPAHLTDDKVVERAQKYLAKIPPAVSGRGGHSAAFHAACVLVLGFDLSPEQAYQLLAEWNQSCKPPWSEYDLRHKLSDANKQPGDRGYLKNGNSQSSGRPTGQNRGGGTTTEPTRRVTVWDDEGRTDTANAQRLVDLHGRVI